MKANKPNRSTLFRHELARLIRCARNDAKTAPDATRNKLPSAVHNAQTIRSATNNIITAINILINAMPTLPPNRFN